MTKYFHILIQPLQTNFSLFKINPSDCELATNQRNWSVSRSIFGHT